MSSRQARRKRAEKPRRDNTPLLIIGGVAAVLFVALLVASSIMRESASAPTNTSGRIWGNANAKVTIDEWSDFQ